MPNKAGAGLAAATAASAGKRKKGRGRRISKAQKAAAAEEEETAETAEQAKAAEARGASGRHARQAQIAGSVAEVNASPADKVAFAEAERARAPWEDALAEMRRREKGWVHTREVQGKMAVALVDDPGADHPRVTWYSEEGCGSADVGWWHCVYSHPFSAGLSVGHNQKRVRAAPEPAVELQLGGVPATVTVTGSISERGTLFFKARLGECVFKSSFTSRARLVGLGMFDMVKEVEKMCGEPDPPKAYTNLCDKFATVQGGGASTSTEPAPEEGMRTRNTEPPEKRMRTRKDELLHE